MIVEVHHAHMCVAIATGFDFRGWALEGWSDKQRNWVMLDAPNSGSQSKLLTSPFGANTFQVRPPSSRVLDPKEMRHRVLRGLRL